MNQQQKNILRDHLRYKAKVEQERKDKENRPERSIHYKWENDPMSWPIANSDDIPSGPMG